jgi:hypothetical protein
VKIGDDWPVVGDTTCKHCTHPLGPHEVVNSVREPLQGGFGVCPTPGCPCFFTWSLGGFRGPISLPDAEEIQRLRNIVQSRPQGS